MRRDLAALADTVLESVKAYCAAEFERRAALLPAPRDGIDGKSVDPDEVAQTIKALLDAAVKELPAPEKGDKGEDGRPGADGKAIDPIEVDALVKQHVAKVVAALPPAQKGDPGEKGEPGDRGDKGEDGLSIPGTPGEPGRDGRDGKSGPAGRDALQIDPIEGIDEARSYARGTYASHLGGLWRADEDTEGLKGWRCLVSGFAAPEIELAEDGRTVIVRSAMSAGKVVEKSFQLPVQIYRGVYREGETYERGDTATWAGSLWHANEKTADKPGDGSKWSLAVKKGRDGKDGEKGETGPAGKPAR